MEFMGNLHRRVMSEYVNNWRWSMMKKYYYNNYFNNLCWIERNISDFEFLKIWFFVNLNRFEFTFEILVNLNWMKFN